MQPTQLLLYVYENAKYDGTTHRVELAAVKLDNGHYIHPKNLRIAEADSGGNIVTDESGAVFSDTKELFTSEEEQEFLQFVSRAEKAIPNWVYTDNPEVYGYPEKTEFEVCGVRVKYEDVDGCTQYDTHDEDVTLFVVELNAPAELVYRTLEPNYHNNGFAVTLYFAGEPTLERVKEVCIEHKLSVDLKDKYFAFEEHSTPVSERANLHRYQVYPTC